MSGAPLAALCPRCGGGFDCGVDAGHCDCFGLRLSEDLRAELAGRYPGRCLCLRCLCELAGAGAAQSTTAARGADAAAPGG